MKHKSAYFRIRVLFTVAFLAAIYTPCATAQLWDQLFEEQLASAEAGDSEAQYEVAIMYLSGRGVEQDFDAALHWLELAAGNGSEQAAGKLSRMEGQKKKFTQALGEAEAGDHESRYDVGMMYLKGRGVKMDAAQGRKWLEKAAAQSDEKAVTRLAILLFKGEGGAPDYGRARQLLDSVSDSSALAQYYLGELYAAGKGVPRDYDAAIEWYRKAAGNGFSMAGGKIINIEEEIRMQNRRKANAKRVAAAKQQQQRAEEAEQNRKRAAAQQLKQAQKKKAVAATSESTTKPKPVAKSKPKPKKAAIALSPLEKLANTQWLARNNPLEYLPSTTTQCEIEGAMLICFSDELKRDSGNQTVLYKVQSEVRKEKGGFSITYRNLVLGVENMEDPEDEGDTQGYGDEVDKGFAIQTGWTKAHEVTCERDGSDAMNCVKDKTHRVRVVEDVRVAVSGKD